VVNIKNGETQNVLSLTLFFNNASIKNSKQAHTDTGANKG